MLQALQQLAVGFDRRSISKLKSVCPYPYKNSYEDYVADMTADVSTAELWLLHSAMMISLRLRRVEDVYFSAAFHVAGNQYEADVFIFSDDARFLSVDDLDDTAGNYHPAAHMLLNVETIFERLIYFTYLAKEVKSLNVKSYYAMKGVNISEARMVPWINWYHNAHGNKPVDDWASVIVDNVPWFKYRVTFASAGTLVLEAFSIMPVALTAALMGDLYANSLLTATLARDQPWSAPLHRAIPERALAFAHVILTVSRKELGQFFSGAKAVSSTPANTINMWRQVAVSYQEYQSSNWEKARRESLPAYIQRIVALCRPA